jgi:dipeptidyl aminopeptidase/acylaminoacyl peptidase
MNSILLMTALFVPHDYSTLDPFDQEQLPHQKYVKCIDWYQQIDDAEFLSITYVSDEYQIKGIIGKPKNVTHPLPVILYNRGGSNNAGKINVKTLRDKFYYWIQKGYMVIASQYRGTDGGQGTDELGGADIADVLNLFQVLKELPYADTNNIYMIGHSRGAMMGLMALREQVPVKAAVFTGAVTDYFALEKLRPDLIPLFNTMIPGMPEHKEEAYTRRSAIRWVNEINTPILLIHGDADTVINVSQSITLAQELEKYSKPCWLGIYPDGDHALAKQMDEINETAWEWFGMVSADIK